MRSRIYFYFLINLDAATPIPVAAFLYGLTKYKKFRARGGVPDTDSRTSGPLEQAARYPIGNRSLSRPVERSHRTDTMDMAAIEGKIEITLREGHRVVVSGAFDPEAVSRLLRGLEE